MLHWSPFGYPLDNALDLSGPQIHHMLNWKVVPTSKCFCHNELMKCKVSVHCWSHKIAIQRGSCNSL